MTQAAANPYLKTKILTASAEELRLMLYDGAVKFCRQARHALTQPKKDFETSYTALSRAKAIILELSNSLNHSIDADLTGKLAALYDYMYRRLVDANMERDESAIDEVIRLLDYERETWALAMKKLQEQRGSDAAAPTAAPEPVPNPIATIGPSNSAQSAPRFTAQG